MKMKITVTVLLAIMAAAASAQQPASEHDRGSSLQAWQDARYADVLASCSNPPAPRTRNIQENNSTPPMPSLPVASSIPGVIQGGKIWQVVWRWEGNNADGPIAGENGNMLFANNDAGNVMEFDPESGLARIIHDNINTAGAVSRNKNGELFVGSRGIGTGIEQLEPERKLLANTYNGEPLECVGGGLNDLIAAANGGVYFSVSGSGVFYANPEGVVSKYGDVPGANGIILSPDEQTLYATNSGTVVAFDVQEDGSLTNQRDFGPLQGGGDGSAVDSEGRLYVATGRSADVFAPDGTFLGSIPGPRGMHGVAFGGEDKKTLYGIVFYGAWGTQAARNAIVAIDTIAQGFLGRAK
ncbi:MAG: SMP-30/gluconolactonase/LRE family protein [Gammaproteobacteria bacterium]|nr:SMP-30/gluconolactonase/LRE family protein [Gammaproteobacteria bacterium]